VYFLRKKKKHLNTDRALQFVIYFTIFWSVLSLGSTGQIPIAPLALFAGLVAYSIHEGSLLRKIPGFLWMTMTILAFVGAIFAAGYDFLLALVFLFFYLILNKLCNPMSSRDEMQVVGLCFFLCVSSTVITDNVIYAIFICGYLLLFTLAMLLITWKSERLEAEGSASIFGHNTSEDRPPESPRTMGAGALIWFGSRILMLVIPAGAILFLSVPRFATQRYLSNLRGIRPQQETTTTGYSESVSLGSMTDVKKDRKVALRVQPQKQGGSPLRLASLYMRGTSLDFYDGRRWLKSRGARSLMDFARTNAATLNAYPRVDGQWVRSKVFLEPGAAPYLFALNYPYAFQFDKATDVQTDYEANSLLLIRPIEEKFTYTTVSRMEDHARRTDLAQATRQSFFNLRQVGSFARIGKLYLQEPRGGFDPRLKALAAEITKDATGSYEMAERIEKFLSDNYFYSLEFQEKGLDDPLVEFLFDRKTGHCEFFATAMAALLRSSGVPARIVNGFFTTEWNDFGEYFIVRQQDAHSWVEAWIPVAGWISFDPTPPAGREREYTALWVPAGLQKVYDTVKFRWYQYVIDYSLNDQLRLGRNVGLKPGMLYGGLYRMRDGMSHLFERDRRAGSRFPWKELLFAAGGVLGMITLGAYILRRLRRAVKRTEKRTESSYRRPPVSVEYAAILAALEAIGHVRNRNQTPREFAARVALAHEALSPLTLLTRRYYEIRYRETDLSPADLKMFRDFLGHLRSDAAVRQTRETTIKRAT